MAVYDAQEVMSDYEIQEFQALRQEIVQRSSFQHAFLLLNITAAGAVLAFSLSRPLNQWLYSRSLLVIPPLSCILFMLWYDQALAIEDIGAYIRQELMPNRWEDLMHTHLTKRGKYSMRAALSIGLLGSFVGVPCVSLFVFLFRGASISVIDNTLISLCVVATLLNLVSFIFWFFQLQFGDGVIVRKRTYRNISE